ncbi:MAG: (Fe-S)-binding protein [Campylobacteraceae bacterium]|nr:(Fe-S)-binding protein [Campylobacteraceae bacterium]
MSKFDYKAVADQCVKCGKCIPTCTIYQVNRDEATSPRGFLDLLAGYQNGDLKLDKNLRWILEKCFLCTNCVSVCPNSLPVDALIEQARYEIAQKYGIAWYKRLAFFFLNNRKVMDIAGRLGYVFQSCAFKLDGERKSMYLRKFPLIRMKRLMPSLAKKSFLNSYADVIENGGKGKVGIFIGCMANYMYTDVGKSLLYILKVLEIDAYLIKQQKCCGAPQYFTGDFKSVNKLAKFNIEYIEGFVGKLDAVIIPEATCCGMIKNDYEHFFHDQPEWRDRAKNLKDFIFLATEYLNNRTNLAEVLAARGAQNFSVTYHDPCHARKMLGVYKEPRNLIGKNFKLIEMSNPNQCCGFGGVSMQTNNYKFAVAAGKGKAKMIDETNANYVSAECSACRMQLGDAMHKEDVKTIFKNPIELIAMALGQKD